MGETVPGQFCWHDLMTKDPETAERYYGELFGWTVNPIDMGEFGTYRMLHAGGREFGGIVELPPDAEAPSHWIGYVTVDDVDAALERAAAGGGRVCVPGTDIPNVGRFGVVADPQGAVISPFRSLHGEPPDPEGPPPPGTICWNELLTTDDAGARAFYDELFGWKARDVDMGEAGVYTLCKRGDRDAGGIMQMPPEADAPPHWLPYVAVENADAAAGRIADLGGTIQCPPTDVPGIGRFAVGREPTGAGFAVFQGVSEAG